MQREEIGFSQKNLVEREREREKPPEGLRERIIGERKVRKNNN